MKKQKFRILFCVLAAVLGCCACGRGETEETGTGETGSGAGSADREETVQEPAEAADSEESAQKQSEAAESTPDSDSAYAESIYAEAGNYDLHPEGLSLTITATGDCTLGVTQKQSYEASFDEYYDEEGESWFFDGVRDIFEADNFTLVNLECVLTEETEPEEKEWNLKGRPEYADILKNSFIEGASLGNNHTMDYGIQSLYDTQEALDGAGIVYAYNEQTGIYRSNNGLTIGIVSANLCDESPEAEDYIRDGIDSLDESGVSLIIACCHWGTESVYEPDDYQIQMAHQIIDWGADLVIGNHPHVLQGIEYYNGKLICYSLGNFCFGGNKNPTDKNTALFQQTFTFVDGELQDNVNACIIPCTVSGHAAYNDFQPTVAEGDTWDGILSDMNEFSSALSEVFFLEDGTLTLNGTGSETPEEGEAPEGDETED